MLSSKLNDSGPPPGYPITYTRGSFSSGGSMSAHGNGAQLEGYVVNATSGGQTRRATVVSNSVDRELNNTSLTRYCFVASPSSVTTASCGWRLIQSRCGLTTCEFVTSTGSSESPPTSE